MPEQKRQQLSISIVVYHAPIAELSSMLDSILQALLIARRNELCAETAITLIDNSEDNNLALENFAGIEPMLLRANAELELIQGHGNIGYGAAHNLALANLTSEYHLIMNPDIEIDGDSLILGIKYLQGNPDVAAISPAATYSDGTKQYLCKRFPSVFDFFLRGFMPSFIRKLFSSRLARFEMRDLPDHQPTKGVPIISGCFMLCRSSALKEVKGFDPRYFLYFEDFDLSLRLTKIYKLAHLPTMKVIHHGGNSARKGGKHIGLFVDSGRRFFSDYGWRWF